MLRRLLRKFYGYKELPQGVRMFKHKQADIVCAIDDLPSNQDRIEELRQSGIWEEITELL